MKDSMTPFVHSVQFYQINQLVLSGNMPISTIGESDETVLMIKKRKTSNTYTFPLDWPGEGEWSASINLAAIDFSTGKWDFYLADHEKSYRLKASDQLLIDKQDSFMLNQSDHTYNLRCYVTKKTSLSLNAATPVITLGHIGGFLLENQTARITGKGTLDFTDAALVIKQTSNGSILQTSPLFTTQTDDETDIYADIDYQTIHADSSINKWDVYIRMKQAGNYYLYRLAADDTTELERSTCTEWYDDELSLIHVYTTIHQNLSIKRTGMTIKRDITSFHLDQQALHLKGYAYLDLIPFNRTDNIRRHLLIRKRHSEEELTISLDNIMLSESEEHDHHYTYAGFNISLPLRDIQAMHSSLVDLYDITLSFEYLGYMKEKRLGFESFDFHEDGPLADVTFRQGLKGVRSFLLTTPRGNLKLENYTYPYWKMWLLDGFKKRKLPDTDEQDIWLVGERPDTAQDTGYHFFKYCREHFPEKPVYYVIQQDSPDYERVRPLGHVIPFGSLKHFQMTARADTFIGSHSPEYLLPTKGLDWPNYQNGTRVFLQHGVLGRKKVDYAKSQYLYPFSVFCVSSEPERDMVINQLGYEPEEIYVTGLSRFDELHHRNTNGERSILLMPTWREWLSYDSFTESEYFQRYRDLLADSRLRAILEEHDIHLDFYPHYRMQPFVDDFKALASDRIHIVTFEDSDVQSLLIKNQLLITDYSSVSFDFNYMEKPVLFYHFDFDRFFKKGLLRPADETFLGEIYHEHETLLQAISEKVQTGLHESPQVTEQKENIFTYIDDHNNERILQAIADAKNKPDA